MPDCERFQLISVFDYAYRPRIFNVTIVCVKFKYTKVLKKQRPFVIYNFISEYNKLGVQR